MQLSNAPDIKIEQKQFIERVWGKYSFTGITELAKYMKKSYPEFSISDNTVQKIDIGDYLDSKYINEITSAAVNLKLMHLHLLFSNSCNMYFTKGIVSGKIVISPYINCKIDSQCK